MSAMVIRKTKSMKTLTYFSSPRQILMIFLVLGPVLLRAQTTYIRTVVHVLYTNAGENLSDVEVMDIINEANKGYSKQQAEKFTRTPDIFGNDWANTNIQLCLATVDPDGNSTSGITHTSIADPLMPVQNPVDIEHPVWDPTEYLNIYLALVFYEPGFPDFVLGGWASSPTNPQMGATFNYVTIATNSVPFIPELLCHETGHVFGLDHLSDDTHADTPKGQENISPMVGYSTSCSSALQSQNTTNLGADGDHWGGVDAPDMVENFMGLTFCCQFMFTAEQATTMQNYINTHLSSWKMTNCETTNGSAENLRALEQISVFPNPAYDKFIIQMSLEEQSFQLAIIDCFGSIKYQQSGIKNQSEIDISNLASGVYIIQIRSTEGIVMQTTRLIKV